MAAVVVSEVAAREAGCADSAAAGAWPEAFPYAS